MYPSIVKKLISLGSEERAIKSQRFFKCALGEYGYGDKFLGITNPVLRQQISDFSKASLTDCEKLLQSSWHEIRLFGLFLLVYQYQRENEKGQKKILDLYLNNTTYINNWDLVDSSAYQIVGHYLFTKDKSVLVKLAKSDSLWERRIAVVSTYFFIKNHQYDITLLLAQTLLNDQQDLIHKAVGWMLRELGKRDKNSLDSFLLKHYQRMPRTMLRYAIEKHNEGERQGYLQGLV